MKITKIILELDEEDILNARETFQAVISELMPSEMTSTHAFVIRTSQDSDTRTVSLALSYTKASNKELCPGCSTKNWGWFEGRPICGCGYNIDVVFPPDFAILKPEYVLKLSEDSFDGYDDCGMVEERVSHSRHTYEAGPSWDGRFGTFRCRGYDGDD